MLLRRFTSFTQFNNKFIGDLTLASSNQYNNFINIPICNLKPPLNIVSTSKISPLLNYFSTVKKTSKNSLKQIYKLNKTQLLTDQKGQKYFLLYEASKQQKSFQIVSALFVIMFSLSLVKLYYTESSQRGDDYIILFVVIGSFIVYQRRMTKTLKKITLNNKGDTINISTFNYFAKGEATLEAPVQIMSGFSRATRLGGYILKGGGKSSGYKQMKFWFSKQYITDQPTFQYVGKGKCPKVVDQYQTL